MATIITKNSSTASSVPLNTQLVQGELAVNVTDKRLFTENSSGTVVELGTNPSSLALPNGSANGVAYLNGSKVLTTGSALTYNGSVLGLLGQGVFRVDGAGTTTPLVLGNDNTSSTQVVKLGFSSNGVVKASINAAVWGNDYLAFNTGSDAEQMRLTSTGLGIGTSSPGYKLDVFGNASVTNTSYKGGAARASVYFRVGGNASEQTTPISAISAVDTYPSAGYGGSLVFSTTYSGTQYDRMTLDSSGNLGLGVTPSAWGGGFKGIDVAGSGGGSFSANGTSAFVSNNTVRDSSGWKYNTSYYAALYAQNGEGSGGHQWYVAGSGTAGHAISFTQAMTLTADGRLLINDTSGESAARIFASGAPSSSGDTNIVLYDSVAAKSVRLLRTGSAYNYAGMGASESALYTSNSNLNIVADGGGGVIKFNTGSAASERARIDSSGNLLVGTTSNHGTYAGRIYAVAASSTIVAKVTSNPGNPIIFINSSDTLAGYINVNGTTTSYNTSSDYRLKEDIRPMTGALAKVAALKPCTYKWKADGSDGEGFIAHELAEVVPQCVTGEKDAVDAEGKPLYQGIDTSFLVATLTAAIQEQQAIIISLTERIAALEAA